MDIARLIPAPDAIPVASGWLQVLLLLTFTLHLLCMNAMLGGAIIALVSDLYKRHAPHPLARQVSRHLPYTIAFTVNLGVAPLLFLQVLYGHLMYTSSVLMAVYWLAVILLVMIAYYSAYLYDFKFEALGAARRLPIAVAVVLLLAAGFVFSNNMTLMLVPGRWTAYFANPHGTLLNLGEPTLIPRYLHFMTASVAVGGLFLALVAHFKTAEADRPLKVRSGLRWLAGGTGVQMLVGLWFLLRLPRPVMMLFMGGDALATGLLVLGLAGAVLAMMFGFRGRLWPAAAAALATVVDMVMMRDLVRSAYLAPYFRLSDLPTVPQYGPLILFLAALVAGLALVVYMLRLAARSTTEA